MNCLDLVSFKNKIKSLLNSDKLFMHVYPSPRHISKKNNLSIVPLHSDSQYNPSFKEFYYSLGANQCI